jgi:hypothetical protein
LRGLPKRRDREAVVSERHQGDQPGRSGDVGQDEAVEIVEDRPRQNLAQEVTIQVLGAPDGRRPTGR